MMSMITLYANIPQTFCSATIPHSLLTERLKQPQKLDNPRLLRKYQARWVAHFLLWQGLQYYGRSAQILTEIQLAQNGRPRFSCQDIDFNISHSGDWVAVMMSNQLNSAVGIDIEFATKPRDYFALMQYFASATELSWFARQADKRASFYRCWCIREAILKSQGAGIAHLSAVEHDPEGYQLACQYSPKGTLYYCQHLPFYLAMFSAKGFASHQLFQWENNRLNLREWGTPIGYQVN